MWTRTLVVGAPLPPRRRAPLGLGARTELGAAPLRPATRPRESCPRGWRPDRAARPGCSRGRSGPAGRPAASSPDPLSRTPPAGRWRRRMASSASPSTADIDAIGVLQQDPPARQRGQAGTEDLAVERVGQGHLLAAPVAPDSQHRRPGRAPRAGRRRRSSPASTGRPAPRRRGRRARPRPTGPPPRGGRPRARTTAAWSRPDRPTATRRGAGPADCPRARRARAPARTGRCPCTQSRSGWWCSPRPGRAAPGAATCPPRRRSRSSRSMRRTRARCHSESNPGGRVASVRAVATQEHQVGVDQLPDQGGGRGVEQVEIVDEQHQRTGGGLFAQHEPDLGHDRDQVATLVGDARREEVGQGPEGHRGGTLGGRGPGHAPAGPSARARHSSARRVLPTPAAPKTTNPWARASASVAMNRSSWA